MLFSRGAGLLPTILFNNKTRGSGGGRQEKVDFLFPVDDAKIVPISNVFCRLPVELLFKWRKVTKNGSF